MWVLQARGEPDLPLEPVLRRLSASPWREDLDGHRPHVAPVHSAVHDGRRAASDLVAEQDAAAGQVLPQIRHGESAPRLTITPRGAFPGSVPGTPPASDRGPV